MAPQDTVCCNFGNLCSVCSHKTEVPSERIRTREIHLCTGDEIKEGVGGFYTPQ